jgi:hypothetical protein
MKHIRPYPISGPEVIDALGSDWVCPYCRSESPVGGDDDITWVPVPVESSPQRYMCLGCCEDIHSTCASDDFDDHPYNDIVSGAAKCESLTVSEFRALCLRQQIEAGKQRIERERDIERYGERLARLESLFAGLKV